MRVVVVARKPVSEGTVAANVLTHGTGAIHIDASRIASEDGSPSVLRRIAATKVGGTRIISRGARQDAEDGRIQRRGDGQAYCVPRAGERLGRWPANMILEHMPGCRLEGTCSQGCPVADLDVQGVYGAGSARDVGGASRFFKQVKGEEMSSQVPESLISYLHTLITPTQVGGETLIVLDLDPVDWTGIPDGRYHGVIARGEPTPEQVAHLWRVVKPGAHVLLIAPDTCPTGHHGACALEDQGFEIRDAILWVREAGRLHYVPKANSRERHAGCDALAAKRKGPPTYELEKETAGDEELVGAIQAALLEAGVAEDVVDGLLDAGIPKDKVPEEYAAYFKKKAGGGKYGNSHPTVKPIAIMERLLQDIPEEALVLDPFLGSGTTALACMRTGHDFIGIEREPNYLEIADTRVHYHDRISEGWVSTTIVSEAATTGEVAAELEGGIFDL